MNYEYYWIKEYKIHYSLKSEVSEFYAGPMFQHHAYNTIPVLQKSFIID